MLPPFIIEQIRKREESERSDEARPAVQLPLRAPVAPEPSTRDDAPTESPERGVVVIDLLG